MFKNIHFDDKDFLSNIDFNHNTIMTEKLKNIMYEEDFIFPNVCVVPLIP